MHPRYRAEGIGVDALLGLLESMASDGGASAHHLHSHDGKRRKPARSRVEGRGGTLRDQRPSQLEQEPRHDIETVATHLRPAKAALGDGRERDMSKQNMAFWSVLGTAAGTAVTVIWMASAKASDIETSKTAIETVKSEVRTLQEKERSHGETLSRLDERTIAILRILEAKK